MYDDLMDWRRERLQAASDRAGGDAELGRMLGHKSGAQIGHMLLGRRPVTEKTIQKVEGLRGFSGWFGATQVSPSAMLGFVDVMAEYSAARSAHAIN